MYLCFHFYVFLYLKLYVLELIKVVKTTEKLNPVWIKGERGGVENSKV